jgi:LPS O-antigen subunit length determinant protein (WzzB/FepE family)
MTGLSEIKQVLAQLLQEETKKLTLIEANQYYVFDYIDPPAVMEQHFQPNRVLLCILFALFGGILSIVLVLFKHFRSKEKVA